MLLWILAGLVLLLVVVFAVGHLLPAVYRGDAAADLPVSPAIAWAGAHAVEQVPLSAQSRSVDRLPDVDGRPSWVESLGATRLTVVTESWDPPRAAVRRVTDAEAPITMRMTLALEPSGAGTRVTATMEIEIATSSWHGPLLRWAMLVGGGANRPARSWVRRLGRACTAAAARASATSSTAPERGSSAGG